MILPFEKVYCLNISKSRNRKKYMKEMFKQNNIENDIIYTECVDLDFLKTNPYKDKLCSFLYDMFKYYPEDRQTQYRKGNVINVFSNFLNHYQIIKYNYDIGTNTICIFEDDTYITNKDLLEYYLNNIPNDWDVIRFGIGHVFDFSNEDSLYIRKYGDFWGNQCYALNRKGMKLYLDYIAKDTDASDKIWKYIDKQCNIYYTKEKLVQPNYSFDSTIAPNINTTIPKRIYQIWLKKNLSDVIPQKSKEFMDNVKKWCSENGYEYVLIDNNSNIYKECINTSLFCKTQLKFWHSCALSDYIRLYVLNKYGGIYLDSDVKIHKGFDELLNNEYFICCEPQNWKGNKIFGRIDCGTMASLPNNELYQIIINIFDKCLYNCYLGTDDITKYLRNNYNINENYKIWIAIPEIVPFVIEKIMKKQILYINEPKPLNISDNTFDIYNSHFFSNHGRYVEHCFHTTWL